MAVGVVVVVLVAILALILPSVYAVWRHNSDMESWREEIEAASEVNGAELVELGSRFGLQPMTNGNHCDREAWLVYETDLSAPSIEAHFDAIEWSSANDLDRTSWWVSSEAGSGVVRVDFWYRFESAEDPRCW